MNPWLQLLFIALAIFAVIFVLALACAVFVLSAGKRYSEKVFEVLKEELVALMSGKEGSDAMAEKLLDGEVAPEECPLLPEENVQKVCSILDEYRQEQERYRKAAEENAKNRPQTRRVLKFLTEKKDKGEWI